MELKTVIVIDNSSYPLGGTAQVAFISALELKRRTFGGVDRTWSNREYNLIDR